MFRVLSSPVILVFYCSFTLPLYCFLLFHCPLFCPSLQTPYEFLLRGEVDGEVIGLERLEPPYHIACIPVR